MDAAIQSMIDNLPKNTGRSLDEWFTVLDATGLDRHSELMAVLKGDHGVSHGYANGIALQYRNRGTSTTDEALVDAQFTGSRAALRPLYDAVVQLALTLGPDVTVAPKKATVSLRRKKQFALVEPGATRLTLGLNLKGTPPTERLKPTTGMCTHKVVLTTPADLDDQLRTWLETAYAAA